ncbi:MAG: methanogenesis marker 17 protein [archaeon]|nr:methanogenesis marker 17 protein [archaeon]
MNIEVTGPDVYANDTYKTLFKSIMSDVGKAIIVDKAKIVLKPDIPLFIFSVRLANKAVGKTIMDVASIRQEGKETHLCITDEKFAPEILSQLWKNYGRNNIDQQTRFDLVVNNGNANKISSLSISSEEDSLKEIIGALWRIMPEGIRNRHNISDANVITIIATEEIMRPEMIEEGKQIHRSLGGMC